MIKKFTIATLAAATLGLGLFAATPAEAGIGLGFGFGFGTPYYGDPYYGYPYRYRHFHHYPPARHCFWQTIRHHHRWVQVRRCRLVYY
jgi:hypothetical protein